MPPTSFYGNQKQPLIQCSYGKQSLWNLAGTWKKIPCLIPDGYDPLRPVGNTCDVHMIPVQRFQNARIMTRGVGGLHESQHSVDGCTANTSFVPSLSYCLDKCNYNNNVRSISGTNSVKYLVGG